MADSLPPRIDVHSHFLPPFYSDALIEAGQSKPDGMPGIPPWSIEAHLKMMESANVTKSILSISSPGTLLNAGDDDGKKNLTRQCNAYAASLKKTYPQKFGFWASLPLPDVKACLTEIDQAVEEGCDGFGLFTNYHGKYLGDPAFDPVFERLNELNATIFIHPTTPCIAQCNRDANDSATVLKALPLGDQLPVPMFEFLFDTSRAVINLFYSGTIDRCANITIIAPHVGGTLPPLISRFSAFGALVPGVRKLDPVVVRGQLEGQFYWDLAGLAFDDPNGRGQLKAFIHGFDFSYQRLLYGSDFPFTSNAGVLVLAKAMKNGLEQLFDEAERDAIYEKNAEKLLQRSKFSAMM